MDMLPDAYRLIDAAISATGKRAHRRAERALYELPDQEAVPALISALRTANTKRTYLIVASLLAERACEEAVTELAQQARENKRFPRLPIRALGQCDHPATAGALIELMEHGRTKQRATAMTALGRLNTAAAIEPLCRMAKSNAGQRESALRILQGMGTPAKLALRAIQDTSLSESACARAILSLEIMPVYAFILSFRSFNGEPFLERLSARGGPLAPRAAAVLQRIREQRTLLRAADAGTSDLLLRPANGSTTARPDELLRAADPQELSRPHRPQSLWKRILRRP